MGIRGNEVLQPEAVGGACPTRDWTGEADRRFDRVQNLEGRHGNSSQLHEVVVVPPLVVNPSSQIPPPARSATITP